MNTAALLKVTTVRSGWIPGLAASAWASTVLLVLIGSIVRVTGHGLGCPDWPLCYGQAIPPAYGGAWVEFSHRLFSGIASIQVVLLAGLAWRERHRRRWPYRPAVAAAGLLAVQVLLGGLHVVLELPAQTGLLHTGLAMLIVGLLAAQLAGSEPRLAALGSIPAAARPGAGLHTRAALAAGATYALLLTGSAVTRSGASLACLEFPACGAAPGASPALVALHLAHRYLGLLILGLLIWLLRSVVRGTLPERIRRFGYALGLLFGLQLAVGALNVLLRLPMWSRAVHLTLGALFWSGVVLLWAASAAQARAPAEDTP